MSDHKQLMAEKPRLRRGVTGAAAVAVAVAAAVPAPARAANQDDATTISWSGATFMRSFTTSRGISLLNPGTSITLNSGPDGAPVTYSAAGGSGTSVQLAPSNLTNPAAITPNPVAGAPAATTANYNAIRFEWHEEGSIGGILELINDQVGWVPSTNNINRNGSAGNPTWVNSNAFGRNGTNVIPANAPFGSGTPGVTGATVNGHTLRTSSYNTYTDYDDSNAARPGRNVHGGRNRVQFAVSDVAAQQGFARAGAAAWHRNAAQAGYGQGNRVLTNPVDGVNIGVANARHAFNDGSVANMSASDTSNGRNGKDPTTGQAYASGAWNTAGSDNLRNSVVANGGLAYVANPGTGLERVNRSDNVWLHAAGRLRNGADFNVVTRDLNSGTLNTAASNAGLDPSFATGENDAGGLNSAAVAERRIGSGIRFSNKSSGGQGVSPTVQASRMSFGHLSSSDSIPTSRSGSSSPMRSLDYRDDDNDVADGSNNALAPERRNNKAYADPISGSDAGLDIVNGFTRLSATSIVEGSYASRTNQTYVSLRVPDAAKYDLDFIKGDNSGNDVRDFRDNIQNAVANFPAASVANPADQLLQLSYMLPQFVKVTKDLDGLNRDVANPLYNASLSSTFLSSPALTAPFNPDAPGTITTGTGAVYGLGLTASGAAPAGGNIPITANNYLFGDFRQTSGGKGVRDYSDLAVARDAQAALHASGLGNNWDQNAGSNATAVTGLPAGVGFAANKGDLIALGDFDSDGDFDGQDLYRMARGTALADSRSSETLTGNFADSVRHGVLRKNAALDQLAAAATPRQRIEASANLANDPNGVNAFNKFDVNRDGRVNRQDAAIVTAFVGKDYRKLDDQLGAVVATNLNPAGTAFPGDPATSAVPRRAISLVDVELTDDGGITHLAPGASEFSDAKLIIYNLQGRDVDPSRTGNEVDGINQLLNGDTNFDGAVGFGDLGTLLANYNDGGTFGEGDTNFDGAVGFGDLGTLLANYNNAAVASAPAIDLSAYGLALGSPEAALLVGEGFQVVPEPSSVGLLALGGLGLLGRRRRRDGRRRHVA